MRERGDGLRPGECAQRLRCIRSVTDAADVSCDGSLPQHVVAEHIAMGATCGIGRTLALRCDDGHDLSAVSQSYSSPVFIEFIESKGKKGSENGLRDEPVVIPSEAVGLELVGVTSSAALPTTSFSRRREHAEGPLADELLSPTDTNDEHDCRPVQTLHSATGSQQDPIDTSRTGRSHTEPGSFHLAVEEQLSVVQRSFPDAVLQKVPPPDLAKTKRKREKALSHYRYALKVYQLQFRGFGEAAARRALEETYVSNIRTEQHLRDAVHRLNTEQLVNLVRRALHEPSQRDTN